VKRLRLVGPHKMVLQSGNSEFDAIVVDDPADIRIYGVVVARSGAL
jgi:SOS-response transcriptional repressor LexA